MSTAERLDRTACEQVVARYPEFSRGQVFCHDCGESKHIDMVGALERGSWPRCCNRVMSPLSPLEISAMRLGVKVEELEGLD